MNWLIYFIVLTGEGVAGGKPLERSDWPRQTGMVSCIYEIMFTLSDVQNRSKSCCNFNRKKHTF
jgi:hypothetical protein